MHHLTDYFCIMAIRNIIFDLCGPIITIDVAGINRVMHGYGVSSTEAYQELHRARLTHRFESGLISPAHFCQEVRAILHSDITDEQIFEAWNTVITAFPESHIHLLEQLKMRYRLFMLSNSDEVSARFFTNCLNQQAGYDFVNSVFERAYYSCETGMRKPDPAIFRYIMEHHGLQPDETFLIDDNPKHVAGAREAGMHAQLLAKGCDITDLFDGNFQLKKNFT